MEIRSNKTEPLITLRQAILLQKQNAGCYIHSTDEYDTYLRELEKDKELASIKVKKFISRGSSAIAFETEDGDVLKLTQENHFPLNRPHETFDVPVFKKGKIGTLYYYIEEKLYQHGLSEGFVEIVRDMIEKRGYKVNDLAPADIHQIGLSKDGKLYLLDPECAKYKTIFHALYSKTIKGLRRLFK